jgi:hypothetical protein
VGTAPLVEAGPGKLILRNGTLIRPASIKLTGKTSRNQLCAVFFENCSFTSSVSSLKDLIHPDSSGPYYLAWRNCTRYESSGSYRWRIFQDDELQQEGSDKLTDFVIAAPQ